MHPAHLPPAAPGPLQLVSSPVRGPGFSRDEALEGRPRLTGRISSSRAPRGRKGPPQRPCPRHRRCHREDGDHNYDSGSALRVSGEHGLGALAPGVRAARTGAEAAGGRQGARATRRPQSRSLPSGTRAPRLPSAFRSAGRRRSSPEGSCVTTCSAPSPGSHLPVARTTWDSPRNSPALTVPTAARPLPPTQALAHPSRGLCEFGSLRRPCGSGAGGEQRGRESEDPPAPRDPHLHLPGAGGWGPSSSSCRATAGRRRGGGVRAAGGSGEGHGLRSAEAEVAQPEDGGLRPGEGERAGSRGPRGAGKGRGEQRALGALRSGGGGVPAPGAGEGPPGGS